MNETKHKKREQDLDEKMRLIEKDLRSKIEQFSNNLSQSEEEAKKLKVACNVVFFFSYFDLAAKNNIQAFIRSLI